MPLKEWQNGIGFIISAKPILQHTVFPIVKATIIWTSQWSTKHDALFYNHADTTIIFYRGQWKHKMIKPYVPAVLKMCPWDRLFATAVYIIRRETKVITIYYMVFLISAFVQDHISLHFGISTAVKCHDRKMIMSLTLWEKCNCARGQNTLRTTAISSNCRFAFHYSLSSEWSFSLICFDISFLFRFSANLLDVSLLICACAQTKKKSIEESIENKVIFVPGVYVASRMMPTFFLMMSL